MDSQFAHFCRIPGSWRGAPWCECDWVRTIIEPKIYIFIPKKNYFFHYFLNVWCYTFFYFTIKKNEKKREKKKAKMKLL